MARLPMRGEEDHNSTVLDTVIACSGTGDLTPFERFCEGTIPQQCCYYGLRQEPVVAAVARLRDIAAEALATAEDYVRSRDLSERAKGYVTARATLRAEGTPDLRMMMFQFQF